VPCKRVAPSSRTSGNKQGTEVEERKSLRLPSGVLRVSSFAIAALLGEAKTEDFDRPVGFDFDVGWLQVSVNHTLAVRFVERRTDLASLIHRLLEGQRCTGGDVAGDSPS
jgi:hypothetical protein